MNQIVCKYCADTNVVCTTKKVDYVMCPNVFKFAKPCIFCEQGKCTRNTDIFSVCPNVLKFRPELLKHINAFSVEPPGNDDCEYCEGGSGPICANCKVHAY